MARIEMNWHTSTAPVLDKYAIARQEAAKQKQLDQDAADAALAAKVKEAVDTAGEKFKAQKADEMRRSIQEYRVTQAPGYVAPELVMHPDGVQRPYRRRTVADVVADAEAALDKG